MITFIGKDTTPLTAGDYRRIAAKYDLESAHVRAVVAVEAGASGFWSSGRMKLLYEGHVAYRETSGALRAKLVKAGVAWKRWGDVPYGKASQSRARLKKAIEIAGDRAYRWASYGLGQIMGFNAELCGYPSAKAMYEAFLENEAAQLDGMMGFIKSRGLLEALRREDWHKFAEGYNGSGYRKHGYHTRLENAYLNSLGTPNPILTVGSSVVLSVGSKGQRVKELQRMLGVDADGHYGRRTKAAVIKFQVEHGLKNDGIAGPKTLAALQARSKTNRKLAVATGLGAGLIPLVAILVDQFKEIINAIF
ncbi:DUF3380 domain-containing protein [Nitratireductor aquibiodomus]|uniref:N-acetylmuramidase domain-containing protein n=1 Tax=Nitratireductor aquibiodomus TaxID=204799 RepID=UPI0019D32DA1|nr:N-acetylmuramidase domain-containing protein [Nitratireductor aquibiodomus]MBN7759798.1 DUF3380 domain-containing protein [Nitratireductor aquibiodomus]